MTRAVLAAAWLAALWLTGCVATPASPVPTPAHGLTLVRCSILADAADLEATAVAYAVRPYPSPAEQERLGRLGLQVAVVRPSDVPAIRERLRTVGPVVETAIGQSAAWLDLAAREASPGVASLGGGTAAGGTLALSVRDWIVPQEDGGCVATEMAMHLLPLDAPLFQAAGQPPRGTLVQGSALACCLQRDEALLVLPRPVTGSGKGPASLAEMPPSPGVFLLGERPLRGPEGVRHASTLLVLMASLPPAMAPPPLDTDQSAADTLPNP